MIGGGDDDGESVVTLSGSFGKVYQCLRNTSLCKKTHQVDKNDFLEKEAQVLKRLRSITCIPKVVCTFLESDGCLSMVMNMLGPSVDQMVKELCNGVLSPASVLKIGIQAIDILAHVHARGYIHHDVKPSNMVMGNGNDENASRIHMIDFGIATEMEPDPANITTAPEVASFVLTSQEVASHLLYCDERIGSSISLYESRCCGITKHVELAQFDIHLRGTPRFCSLRQHFMYASRPCDDYESLAFTLMALSGIVMPWSMEGRKNLNDKAEEKVLFLHIVSQSSVKGKPITTGSLSAKVYCFTRCQVV